MANSLRLVVVLLAFTAGCLLMPGLMQADDTSSRMEQATREMEAGRPAEAVKIFSSLIASEPTAELYYQRALAYGRLREFESALADMNSAITMEPAQSAYYVQKGIFLLRSGRPADAAQEFTSAIELDSANARAFGLRAKSYLLQNSASRGLADVQTAIRLNPDRGPWYVLKGDILGSMGEHDQAVRDYNQALQLRPGDAIAHNNRGVALANLGKTRDAIEDLNEAMEIASSASAAVNPLIQGAIPW